MAENAKIKIGIIGGSGFDDPEILENQKARLVTTPFGEPSDQLLEGTVRGVPCVFLARHGRKHHLQPSDVNYRANIWALKEAGCSHILASAATGSLREEYKPGDLVVVSDVIDRTWGRPCTFYDGSTSAARGVIHLPASPLFCERSRQALISCVEKRQYSHHTDGTLVVIQGPRFSTRAESHMHRQWGAHLVGMTLAPEAFLAKEAGLSYGAVAVITDYDCWRDHEQSVSVQEVLATFAKNVDKAKNVIVDAVQLIARDHDLAYLDSLKNLVASAIMLKD